MYHTLPTRALRHHSLLILLILGGCGASAEEKQLAHLERGDRYFEEKSYPEAIIEYRNVLQLDPQNPHATRNLGLAYFETNQLGQAFRFLQKSREMNADDPEVGLKLATIYVMAGGIEEAKEEINHVLELDPENFDALQVLTETASSPEEIDRALVELERLRPRLDDQARFHVTVGKLLIKKRNLDKAEEAFRRAAEIDPHLLEAHFALGAFYIAKQDLKKAEQEFKTAVEMAPPASAAQINLAKYYVLVGKTNEARVVLRGVTEAAPDYLPAWRRLSQIAFRQQDYEESARALAEILERSPRDVDALRARGELHQAMGETEQAEAKFREALSILREVVKRRPNSASARYRLAQVHLLMNEIEQAKVELRAVQKLAPQSVQAALLLSELNLRTGDADSVIRDLEALLEKQPELVQAMDLLGRAYLSKGEPSKAAETLSQAVKIEPENAGHRYLLGVSLLRLGKLLDASRQLEASLSLSPKNIDALAQLVSLELARNNTEGAIARIEKQIQQAPGFGAHQQLLGLVYERSGDMRAAEAAFKRAVVQDPSLALSYNRLASIYVKSGRLEQAIIQTNEALASDSNNQGLLMLAGQLHQIQGDHANAQQAYEKLLGINPTFAAAANNLALIYAEKSETLDRALGLAETARKAAPEVPEIADTLGWILYKRGIYERALSLLKESVSKLSENAETHYHLGMVYYKLDDKEAAWLTLNRALELGSDFTGADEAREVLEELKKY